MRDIKEAIEEVEEKDKYTRETKFGYDDKIITLKLRVKEKYYSVGSETPQDLSWSLKRTVEKGDHTTSDKKIYSNPEKALDKFKELKHKYGNEINGITYK